MLIYIGDANNPIGQSWAIPFLTNQLFGMNMEPASWKLDWMNCQIHSIFHDILIGGDWNIFMLPYIGNNHPN